MGKESLTQIQEAQRVPYKINPRRNTPRHILIKLTKIKDKEKILKAAREKKQTYKGTPIRSSADFSAETLQARREWHDILKVMKGKNLQPRLLYPARLSFRFEGESQKLHREAKAKRIQQHETSCTTSTKGTSLGRKEKATTGNKNSTNVKADQ